MEATERYIIIIEGTAHLSEGNDGWQALRRGQKSSLTPVVITKLEFTAEDTIVSYLAPGHHSTLHCSRERGLQLMPLLGKR